MKKLARALALALCLLSLASCAQAPQPDPVPPPLEDASFNPDSEGLIRLTEQNARFLGRAFHNSRADEWGVSWTDSGFEIRFVGREVRALLTPQCLCQRPRRRRGRRLFSRNAGRPANLCRRRRPRPECRLLGFRSLGLDRLLPHRYPRWRPGRHPPHL